MMRGSGLVIAVVSALLPGVAAAHEFVAYFEPGSAVLTQQGRTMLAEAAPYALRNPPANRITLVGHVDTEEAATHGDALGAARAQAVASELVALGVDRSLIWIQSQGARQLAKPTAPNVSERLNRRVMLGMNYPPASDSVRSR